MTPDAQRIAIAEACGWSFGVSADDPTECWHKPAWGGMRVHSLVIPDYLDDLNAMAKAERLLTDEQQVEYIAHLLGITEESRQSLWSMSWDSAFYCASALPEQRAEAFLRTIGKWEGTK
jgi:hypothetical protein